MFVLILLKVDVFSSKVSCVKPTLYVVVASAPECIILTVSLISLVTELSVDAKEHVTFAPLWEKVQPEPLKLLWTKV